jgi:hypothetical protein
MLGKAFGTVRFVSGGIFSVRIAAASISIAPISPIDREVSAVWGTGFDCVTGQGTYRQFPIIIRSLEAESTCG